LLLFLLAGLLPAPAVHAACVDVFLPCEPSTGFDTPNGVQVHFDHTDLEREEYFISWTLDGETADPIGPFTLQRSCRPMAFAAENDDFLLLTGGCGTFCWYHAVFALHAQPNTGITQGETLWRPLAFDAKRSLIAQYTGQDEITVRNLRSGERQVIATPYQCESASGLCFRNVSFDDDHIRYVCDYNPDGEQVSHRLNEQVLSGR